MTDLHIFDLSDIGLSWRWHEATLKKKIRPESDAARREASLCDFPYADALIRYSRVFSYTRAIRGNPSRFGKVNEFREVRQICDKYLINFA